MTSQRGIRPPLFRGREMLVYSVTNDKNGKEAREETVGKCSRIR